MGYASPEDSASAAPDTRCRIAANLARLGNVGTPCKSTELLSIKEASGTSKSLWYWRRQRRERRLKLPAALRLSRQAVSDNCVLWYGKQMSLIQGNNTSIPFSSNRAKQYRDRNVGNVEHQSSSKLSLYRVWRRTMFVLIVLMPSLAVGQTADQESANWILPGCRDAVKKDGHESSMAVLEGFCLGKIAAIIELSEAAHLHICLPQGVTRRQSAAVVVQYIDQRPERWQDKFTLLAIQALYQALALSALTLTDTMTSQCGQTNASMLGIGPKSCVAVSNSIFSILTFVTDFLQLGHFAPAMTYPFLAVFGPLHA